MCLSSVCQLPLQGARLIREPVADPLNQCDLFNTSLSCRIIELCCPLHVCTLYAVPYIPAPCIHAPYTLHPACMHPICCTLHTCTVHAIPCMPASCMLHLACMHPVCCTLNTCTIHATHPVCDLCVAYKIVSDDQMFILSWESLG